MSTGAKSQWLYH